MPLIEAPALSTENIWDSLDQYRGNHQVLAQLFSDSDKVYAFVGKGSKVVVRRYHPSADRVDYAIHTRDSFIKAESAYLNRNSKSIRGKDNE